MLFVIYNFVLTVLASLVPEGQSNCRNLKFTSFHKPGYRLENHTVRTIEVFDEDLCMAQCYLEPNCVSYNFHKITQQSGTHKCDLNNATIEHDKDLVKNGNYIYRGAENACARNPCKNNATCQAGFTHRDYQCLCVLGSGFEGHDCDEDMDECVSKKHNCEGDMTCNNTIGSYTCRCKEGYQEKETNCTDLDECAELRHACNENAECDNTLGSYSCTCKDGFHGNGTNCTDLDECTDGTYDCDGNAECNNTLGSYKCTCKDGFQGNGTNCKGFTAVFTNLGKTGRKGPDSIRNPYTGQDHEGQVAVSSGIQQWTVPYTGEYRIEVRGASGGYGEDSIIKNGGRGARMVGNFHLTKDEIINVLVGQKGRNGDNSPKTAGGGGGTFVVRGSNTPLIIAGGGGGIKNMPEQHPGCDASINTTGNAGKNSPWGSGGSNGRGGDTYSASSGGGGGGFYSDGENVTSSDRGGQGGSGYSQGGKGGEYGSGFGCGGGFRAGDKGPGGGGGFSGGCGGANEHFSCGGGGGSFNLGTNQQNECCYNSADHGWVNITFLG